VFYQHAADRRQGGAAGLRLFWRSTAVLAAFGLVPFGLVIPSARMLFAWIFGAPVGDRRPLRAWIAVAYFAFLISFPAKNATALFALQKAFAVTESCRALAAAAAVIVVAQAGGKALTAVAVGALVQSLISLAFVAFVGVRLYRLDRDASPVVAPAS
jgi:O-antigen/teichoic acid export membrane protein